MLSHISNLSYTHYLLTISKYDFSVSFFRTWKNLLFYLHSSSTFRLSYLLIFMNMLNFQCWPTHFALAYRQVFIFKFPQVVRRYIIYFEIVEERNSFMVLSYMYVCIYIYIYIYHKKTSMKNNVFLWKEVTRIVHLIGHLLSGFFTPVHAEHMTYVLTWYS